jgi:pyridoxal phosphate enzyme (YggS family)
MATISANLQAVANRIEKAAREAGRAPESIHLLAVSKTFPADAVRAAAQAGQRCFGENYVQEGIAKIEQLSELGLEWHFIGPLQSNKTKLVAENFDWVHSIDRLKIAERLSAQRPTHLKPLNVCIQVNVSGETSKSGAALNEVQQLAQAIAQIPGLQLRGLMSIPEPTLDMQLARKRFASLRELRDEINRDGLTLDTLSIGMSQDLEAAIMEGATIVRVGTAIFGERHYEK